MNSKKTLNKIYGTKKKQKQTQTQTQIQKSSLLNHINEVPPTHEFKPRSNNNSPISLSDSLKKDLARAIWRLESQELTPPFNLEITPPNFNTPPNLIQRKPFDLVNSLSNKGEGKRKKGKTKRKRKIKHTKKRKIL